MATAIYHCLQTILEREQFDRSTLDSNSLIHKSAYDQIEKISKHLNESDQRVLLYDQILAPFLLNAMNLFITLNYNKADQHIKLQAVNNSWQSRDRANIFDGYRSFVTQYCNIKTYASTFSDDFLDDDLLNKARTASLQEHRRYVNELYGRLADMRELSNSATLREQSHRSRIILSGPPNVGKKAIIGEVIQRYGSLPQRLPILAIIFSNYSFAKILQRFREFYNVPMNEDSLESDTIAALLHAASQKPALIIVCDIYPNDMEPVRRLAQGEDISYLLNAILSANSKSRLICTFESIATENQSKQSQLLLSRIHGVEPEDVTVIKEIAHIDSIARFINDENAYKILLGKIQNEREDGAWERLLEREASGLWLTLAGIALRIDADRFQTQKDTPIFKTKPAEANVTQSATEYELVGWIVRVLNKAEKAIMLLLLVSGDGVRASTLYRILKESDITKIHKKSGQEGQEEHGDRHQMDKAIEDAITSLLKWFGGLIRQRDGHWHHDDPPGEDARSEILYELDTQFRRHLLTQIEDNGDISLREAHLAVSSENRREARNRKLNGAGVHGARLTDMQRDLLAFLNLAASVDPKMIADSANIDPAEQVQLDLEFESVCGQDRYAYENSISLLWTVP